MSTITPLLVYGDTQAAHDFLVCAFGLTTGGVNRDGDCSAALGHVRARDDAIGLHHVNDLDARSAPAALAARLSFAWSPRAAEQRGPPDRVERRGLTEPGPQGAPEIGFAVMQDDERPSNPAGRGGADVVVRPLGVRHRVAPYGCARSPGSHHQACQALR